MSAIILLPIVIPAAAAAWPMVAAAAVAAAGAMGFAAAGQSEGVAVSERNVTLEPGSCSELTGSLAVGETLAFVKERVRISIYRDARGTVSVKVAGEGHTDDQLRAVGQELVGKLQQQYAYNRVVTELKQRNFNLVDQELDEDGTVRLKVRVYQGQ